MLKYKSLWTTIAACCFATAAAYAGSCPTLKEIQHTPGEYSWSSKLPGWEGAFIAPLNGRGFSTQVKRFSQVRWIQFSNLPNSPGYIECDYIGNTGEEVIRFTQINNKATAKPSGPVWVKVGNVTFPSIQRECNVSLSMCQFSQL